MGWSSELTYQTPTHSCSGEGDRLFQGVEDLLKSLARLPSSFACLPRPLNDCRPVSSLLFVYSVPTVSKERRHPVGLDSHQILEGQSATPVNSLPTTEWHVWIVADSQVGCCKARVFKGELKCVTERFQALFQGSVWVADALPCPVFRTCQHHGWVKESIL